jgi:hypothetical protein
MAVLRVAFTLYVLSPCTLLHTLRASHVLNVPLFTFHFSKKLLAYITENAKGSHIALTDTQNLRTVRFKRSSKSAPTLELIPYLHMLEKL